MTANPLAPAWLEQPADANALDARVWPDGTLRRESGELEIGGVPVNELASQFGTPLYVIDEATFRGRARNAKAVVERISADQFRRTVLFETSLKALVGAAQPARFTF